MSKEIEALERLTYFSDYDKSDDDHDLVLNALTEYEAIKKQEPTKALECVSKGSLLYHLYKCFEGFVSQDYPFFAYEFDKFKAEDFIKSINTIKQALIQAEQDKIIADFVRKHYVVGTDINDDFLKLVKPFTQEEGEKVEDIINGK